LRRNRAKIRGNTSRRRLTKAAITRNAKRGELRERAEDLIERSKEIMDRQKEGVTRRWKRARKAYRREAKA